MIAGNKQPIPIDKLALSYDPYLPDEEDESVYGEEEFDEDDLAEDAMVVSEFFTKQRASASLHAKRKK
jgi:hypothetical protein